MTNWIALLRGINVGGRHLLPMAQLRALLAAQGCQNVRTYIQSGNAVFAHPGRSPKKLAAGIAGAIDAQYGFSPAVLVLRRREFAAVLAANPFTSATADKHVHVHFLFDAPPRAVARELDALVGDTEEYLLTDSALYLYAPDGIGRSKFAARFEHTLGVGATGRNLRSARKILALASQAP